MDTAKIKRYFLVGLIGAIITTFAEMLQGWADSVMAFDIIDAIFSTFALVPVWRIALGAYIGAIGIIMQFFGAYAIYLSIKDKNNKSSVLIKIGTFNYAFVGAVVHFIILVSFYFYFVAGYAIYEFLGWFVIPITAIFMIIHIIFSIAVFVKICKKQTIYPAWCCLFNPVIGMAIFSLVAKIIPYSPLSNAVANAHMGLTAVVIFAVLMIKTKADKTSESAQVVNYCED